MSDKIPYTKDLSRRDVMKYVGVSGAVGLAGCLEGDEPADDTETEPDDGSGDDDGDTETEPGEELPDQELFFAQVKGPLDLDPIVLNDVPSAQITGQLFDGLYEYGEGVGVEPKIASAAPEVERDGTRYIVPIRDDAMFQNGDPVTAEDVVHTMVAPFEEETDNAAEVDMIDTAEAIDETTAQFDL
ncbi:MAG: ABC transporter substrate-binding protein, partial [Haloferacaceae archaeon]